MLVSFIQTSSSQCCEMDSRVRDCGGVADSDLSGSDWLLGRIMQPSELTD